MRNLRFLTTLVPRRHVTATCLTLRQLASNNGRLPLFPTLSNVREWFTRWAEARYQDTLWTPTVNCVIPDKQLCRLCNIGWVPDAASLRQAMPEWDPDILGEELPSLIKLLADEERKQKQEEIGQLSGSSGLIMQMSERFSQALEQHAVADERLSQALIRASQVSERRFEISAPWQLAPRRGANISQASQRSAVDLLPITQEEDVPMPSPTLRSPAPTPPSLPLYQPLDISVPPATCQLDLSSLVPQRRSARLNRGKRMRRALQEINGDAN